MALISVIVPVYNVFPYLAKCIDSLVTQTYKELEIILVDDGSTDGSGKLCNQRATQDSRIKVIHSRNRGVSHARNLGLKQAHGDYIGFVDADDWIEKDRYETMLHYINKMHSDIHVGGGFIIETESGRRMEMRKGHPQIFTCEEGLQEMLSADTRKIPLFRGHLCDKLFSRHILDGLNFNENLKLREDTWLVWQAFKRANRISYAPQYSYHYTIRKDSATHVPMKRENGTYMDAMKLILNDTEGLSSETFSVVHTAYESEWLVVMKSILSDNEKEFKDVFEQGQIEIRKDIFNIVWNKAFTYKQKIFFIYFALPRFCLMMGKPLVREVLKYKKAKRRI